MRIGYTLALAATSAVAVAYAVGGQPPDRFVPSSPQPDPVQWLGDKNLSHLGPLRRGAGFSATEWGSDEDNPARAFQALGRSTVLVHNGPLVNPYAGIGLAQDVASALEQSQHRSGQPLEIITCYPQQAAKSLRQASQLEPRTLATFQLTRPQLRAMADAVLNQQAVGITKLHTNPLANSGSFSFEATNLPE